MAFAQKLAERLKASLWDGQAHIRILSHSGFLAADTYRPEQIGSHSSEAEGLSKNWQALKEHVQQGDMLNWQQGHQVKAALAHVR